MIEKSVVQAQPGQTIPILKDQFNNRNETAIYWLGSAGVLINSHGTIILIDPVLDQIEVSDSFFSEENGLRMFNRIPIQPEDFPKVDAVLYTHADDDHIGTKTPNALLHTKAMIHCPKFVKERLVNIGVPDGRIITHPKQDSFTINELKIEMTLADHPWHKNYPELYDWHYTLEDCTGYRITTPDGVIWIPGDSILMQEHLNQPEIDVLLIDFSADPYHFGIDGAITLANNQKTADLIPYHWGTYESSKPCFNANPFEHILSINEHERMHILAIGEKYILKK